MIYLIIFLSVGTAAIFLFPKFKGAANSAESKVTTTKSEEIIFLKSPFVKPPEPIADSLILEIRNLKEEVVKNPKKALFFSG